jgi:hypothetical protein
VIENTAKILDEMRADNSRITEAVLADLSDYCAEFTYENYKNESAQHLSWTFETPWAHPVEPVVEKPWWARFFSWLF